MESQDRNGLHSPGQVDDGGPMLFRSCPRTSPTSQRLVLLLALVCSGLVPCPTRADERDERIRALEKRVEQLEKLLQGQVIGTNANATPTAAAPEPAPKPKPGPVVSIGASGFSIRSADTNFAITLRGLLQLDTVWSDAEDGDDGFLVRRARPILDGTVFRDFDFRVAYEFAASSNPLRDAWLNYRYSPAAQVRVGKMKGPGNLERWQAAANNPFIERSLASLLWPVREVGLMFHGELWPGDEAAARSLPASGLLNYGVGVFNGAGDARTAANADFDSAKSAGGMLFVHPFLKAGPKALQKLGFSVSGTYGRTEGTLGLPDEFEYAADVVADGIQWRAGPGAYWYWGAFGLIGEYSFSSQRLARETPPLGSIRADNQAWSLTATWLLTGENATFRTLTPRKDFNPREGGWGAWQVVVRYAWLDLDDDLFPDYADSAQLPTRIANWGVGLNWYLNRLIRASINYNHFDYRGGRSGSVDGVGENNFHTRVQLAF
jgi:phosphate-selective porin OprO/OprP